MTDDRHMAAMSHWRDRAQQNPYGICPLVVITKGWPYDSDYRRGANEDMHVLQDWLYHQTGKTWRTVPAIRINSLQTAEEHAAGNIYFDIAGQFSDFCNPKRLYVLYSTGYTGLANMAGRSAFGCTPDPSNPYEPWGPGRAGGPSAWAMELVAGHSVELEPGQTQNAYRGATLHESLHCLGVQHPDSAVYGNAAWLSPMAGWWFFGTPECALLPYEIAYLRGSHFFR